MAMQKPCPRCQAALTIPQPPPAQIRCEKCGAIIKNRSAPAATQDAVTAKAPLPVPSSVPAPTAPASANPPAVSNGNGLRFTILAVLAVGVLLVLIVPIVGLALAWILSSRSTDRDPTPSPPVVQTAEPPPPVEIKPAPPPPPDPRIEIVQPAVDKGVAYLKKQAPQLANLRCGYAGLNGLALLECGVPADDASIVRIAEIIRKAAPSMFQIYDLAASLFFLNRWHEARPLDEKDRTMARSFALRIIAGQLTTGIWGYNGVMLSAEQETKLLTTLQEGKYQPTGAQTASMSNTQFAMLAVWGARKHGIQVRDPLLALAAYVHANQHADGCWHYPGHSLKATSTCAGLMALAVETALLEDKEFKGGHRPLETKKKADVDKAFAFVAKTIGRKKGDPNPGKALGYGGDLFDADAIGDLYFLWTLERVGVIYSKNQIGGKDWYDWGYPILMKAQQPDGSWSERHGALIDTSFALLFLKRANIARDLTEMIRTHGVK